MKLAAFFVGALLHAAAPASAGDFQYWLFAHQALYTKGADDLGAAGETRWANDATVNVFRLGSARYRRAVAPWLSAGGNATFIAARAASAGAPWQDQVRLEAEVEPRRRLPMGFSLSNRNRFELRWLDGRGWGHYRLRPRLELSWTRGPFSTTIGDELFVDERPWRVSEHRFVPVSAAWRFRASTLALYHMRRYRRAAGGWPVDSIFGTTLILRVAPRP